MIFKNLTPHPFLSEYVSVYRIRHFIIPPDIKIHGKPYPVHPENCMVFYVRGGEITEMPQEHKTIHRPRSVITGQFTQRINRFSTPLEFLMIQIVFQPGALYRLTGIPAKLLLNQHIELEDVFPKEGRIIHEQLAEKKTYEEMIAAIEHFLISLVKAAKIGIEPIQKVFHLISSSPQNCSIDWLASQAYLSARQFERKADNYVGVYPKYLLRIARFNQSYYMRLKYPHYNWLTIAMACGYHDYQHLAKDYKEFASATPNHFFTQESKTLERVLGLLPQ